MLPVLLPCHLCLEKDSVSVKFKVSLFALITITTVFRPSMAVDRMFHASGCGTRGSFSQLATRCFAARLNKSLRNPLIIESPTMIVSYSIYVRLGGFPWHRWSHCVVVEL